MFVKTLLILLLFIVSGFAVAQEQPPFVYFPYGDGYLIQRADGTDSHFVEGVAGAHPENFGATWSPSGQWLVWRTLDFGGCGMSGEPAEQLIIAGAETAVLLPYGDWVRFTWASTQDQLFVVSSQDNVLQWQIIDPAAPDTPLASGSLDAESGESIALLKRFFYGASTNDPRNNSLEDAVPSPDGQWLAYIEDGPVMVNRVSGETRFVAPSIYGYGGNPGGYIKWHPSQNWFISIEEGIAGCGSSYHTQITDGVTRYDNYSNRVEWMPSQVDPANFPAFENPPQSPQPQPFQTLHAQETITRLIWNDDGSILYAYAGFGTPAPVAAWDAASGEQLQSPEFPLIIERPDSYPEAYFHDVRILDESDTYVVINDGAYDKQSGERVIELDGSLWHVGGIFQISSNEEVVIGSAIIKPLYVWSLSTGEVLFEGLMATAAAISPDSTIVAVASGWDVHLYSAASLGF